MLTSAQITALAADIAADPVLSLIENTPDGDYAVAEAYNAQASPNWTIWRTSVPTSEIMENGFVWSAVDSLTAGKARIWEWMVSLGQINPSKSNIRQGLADAFGASSAMATGIMPHLKKLASRGQKLFSTGTGSNANPATLASNLSDEFLVTSEHVERARRG
jgi:hypothetical protein